MILEQSCRVSTSLPMTANRFQASVKAVFHLLVSPSANSFHLFCVCTASDFVSGKESSRVTHLSIVRETLVALQAVRRSAIQCLLVELQIVNTWCRIKTLSCLRRIIVDLHSDRVRSHQRNNVITTEPLRLELVQNRRDRVSTPWHTVERCCLTAVLPTNQCSDARSKWTRGDGDCGRELDHVCGASVVLLCPGEKFPADV